MPKAPASNPAAETPQVAEFEKSLDELEQLVGRMEHGDLGLDESLQSFERGIALYRSCQGALDQARLRVNQLLDADRPDDAQPFDPDVP